MAESSSDNFEGEQCRFSYSFGDGPEDLDDEIVEQVEIVGCIKMKQHVGPTPQAMVVVSLPSIGDFRQQP